MKRKRLKEEIAKRSTQSKSKLNGHSHPIATKIAKEKEERLPAHLIGKGPNTIVTNVGKNRSFQKMFNQYQPDYPKRAAQMILNGATEKDLIVAFHTHGPVFRMWQLSYPEFAAACVISKQASLADARVVSSMYAMANGYEQPAVKIMNVEGVVKKISYVEHIPKNFNAGKFWLANRDPLNWGRDIEKDSGNKNNATPLTLNVNMLRGMSSEELANTKALLKSMMISNSGLDRLDQIDEAEVIEAPQEIETKENPEDENAA